MILPSHRSTSCGSLSRRGFLAGTGGSLLLPFLSRVEKAASAKKPLRLGLIADLHHGLEPTAQRRIEEFIEKATTTHADGVIQLGDFNFGTDENIPCMETWNRFRGDRFHVLGNHDMDKLDKAAVQDFWGMDRRYYSFDRGEFHFVVMDRNHIRTEDGDVPYAKGNYFSFPKQISYADREQLEWVRADLMATELPIVVFVHQGLGMEDALSADDPREEIESVFRGIQTGKADQDLPGIVACFCGHEHLDRHREKDGIHYVWINSASYYWVGSKYGRMAPYEDALYAFATFDSAGEIRVEGRSSTWAAPSPEERGFPQADEISASISDRQF